MGGVLVSERASGSDDLPQSVALLEKLVAFETTNSNSNLDMIEYLQSLFQDAGIEPWLTYDKDRRKANLFATLPSVDGVTQGGIVLSGHSDVVTVEGQKWSTDPFTLTRRGDRLYGRGSADMKGFIAVCMSKLESLQAKQLRKPLHFAFSFDEEVGCLGAPLMLDEMVRRDIRPEGCLIGEPTSMNVVVAHKGANLYRCRVHGRPAHSSAPVLGVNAIEYAARVICFIRDLADSMKQQGPFDRFFETPYSTAQTGRISGGVATNVVPQLCEFDFEFRNIPQIDAQDIYAQISDYVENTIRPAMREEWDGADIALEKIAAAPGLNADEQAMMTRLVRALTGDGDIRKVAYGTEGGQFQNAGVPAIICGPGSIEQAHRADEFIDIDQIAQCEAFIDALAGPTGIDNESQ
ncbi:acetylornithine deacetylase [Sphingobium subterraneum]|uniref:Acetylornithine deacetylase n=1 Tax=Sphingobium subterraneum TaxID=627688 RepID=A0A841IXP4_9SPHN|nr:acetylornithine deacetylase [Sphingobium subterraneum]MBB6123433.1 acetylornithine deacetylase [Sphingobium subterraneum]